MKEILLKIITLIHVLFVLFVVLTPFLGSTYFLVLHAILVPFIILHWICNDNTCVLTVIEKKLKMSIYGKVDENDCITCKLIEPVYDFKKNYQTFSMLIYGVTICLWLITVGRLTYMYKTGEIKSWRDLFVI